MKHEALWRAARLTMNTVATDDDAKIKEQLAAFEKERDASGFGAPKRKRATAAKKRRAPVKRATAKK